MVVGGLTWLHIHGRRQRRQTSSTSGGGPAVHGGRHLSSDEGTQHLRHRQHAFVSWTKTGRGSST